jgi:predicted outer membrane repeat protein
MKFTPILMIVFYSIYLNSMATHITVSGTVSGTWSVDTVYAVSDLEILNEQTLIIEPGVEVIFSGHYVLRVNGCLKALGEPENNIHFYVADTSGLHDLNSPGGAWNGLWFDHLGPSNDSSVFEHCIFRYGKAVGTDSTFWYGGAVCIREFNRIRFSHCCFENNLAYKNGGAVYARYADIVVEYCTFQDNYCGLTNLYGYGGGLCLEYSDAVINRNLFAGNSSTGVGGGLSFEYADPLISNNRFKDNYSGIGGGFVCLRSDGEQVITNNLVEDNSALFFGGGIGVLETSMLFANNTVVNNSTGGGGGLYFNANSFSVFKNCILWGNEGNAGGPQVYIWDTFSAPEFYYCDVEGGVADFGGTGGIGAGFIGVYENCIEMDPLFTGQGAFPFSLENGSPCMDAGIPDTSGLQLPPYDLAGNSRVRNGVIDMGAYEVQQTTQVNIRRRGYGCLKVFPNPFRDQTTLVLEKKYNGNAQIIVRDQAGKPVQHIMNGYLSASKHRFEISGLDPGIYVVEVSGPHEFEQVKMIVW